MDRGLYERRFHEALSQAFSAQSLRVRQAYFDLASYYREKAGGELQIHASDEVLRYCLRGSH